MGESRKIRRQQAEKAHLAAVLVIEDGQERGQHRPRGSKRATGGACLSHRPICLVVKRSGHDLRRDRTPIGPILAGGAVQAGRAVLLLIRNSGFAQADTHTQ